MDENQVTLKKRFPIRKKLEAKTWKFNLAKPTQNVISPFVEQPVSKTG